LIKLENFGAWVMTLLDSVDREVKTDKQLRPFSS
jgi:hypothetical protein